MDIALIPSTPSIGIELVLDRNCPSLSIDEILKINRLMGERIELEAFKAKGVTVEIKRN
jgi:hypothetical protein